MKWNLWLYRGIYKLLVKCSCRRLDVLHHPCHLIKENWFIPEIRDEELQSLGHLGLAFRVLDLGQENPVPKASAAFYFNCDSHPLQVLVARTVCDSGMVDM